MSIRKLMPMVENVVTILYNYYINIVSYWVIVLIITLSLIVDHSYKRTKRIDGYSYFTIIYLTYSEFLKDLYHVTI